MNLLRLKELAGIEMLKENAESKPTDIEELETRLDKLTDVRTNLTKLATHIDEDKIGDFFIKSKDVLTPEQLKSVDELKISLVTALTHLDDLLPQINAAIKKGREQLNNLK